MISAHNWPAYLRSYEDGKVMAVENAQSNFAVNPSVDAILCQGMLVLLSSGSVANCNGAMDYDMAERFGAQA